MSKKGGIYLSANALTCIWYSTALDTFPQLRRGVASLIESPLAGDGFCEGTNWFHFAIRQISLIRAIPEIRCD